MTDYSKLKVTELKEELKSRNLPLTGLKVKQNFIDKLLEADAADEASNSPAVVTPAVDEASSATNTQVQDEQTSAPGPEREDPAPEIDSVEAQPVEGSAQEPGVEPGALTAVIQDVRSEDNETKDEGSQAMPVTESSDTAMKPESSTFHIEGGAGEPPSKGDTAPVIFPEPSFKRPSEQHTAHASADRFNTPQPHSDQPSSTSTPSSTLIPSAELLEDSRKRKRRSLTPPPSRNVLSQKKAKANNGSPRAMQIEESTLLTVSQPPEDSGNTGESHKFPAQAINNSPPFEDEHNLASQNGSTVLDRNVEPKSRSRSPRPSQDQDEISAERKQVEQVTLVRSPVRSKPRSPSTTMRRSPSPPKPMIDDNRHVSPALHPATTSLYIRNLKRPLNIPSLRSHISALAASPNTGGSNEPIASFYLDSVRTHAFVAFTSVSAASRVRSALHDSRFPDEKTREPLWVDFVPDEKVEDWIETEQKASGGGRGGRRWEVVYQDSRDGIEAFLQEVGSGPKTGAALQRGDSIPNPRQDSQMAMTTPTMPGVHPDRARLVPAEDSYVPQRKESTIQRGYRPEQTGTGFRALDDLFPSTIVKPKLYYKAVDASIAEERLNMIKDLRNLGGAKSGDPDMKRYSFEVDRGRDEWVDKGPEFGYGARGRAVERGGRGGYRGRGGGGRGNDVWRSGGRY
jgi:SAP domain